GGRSRVAEGAEHLGIEVGAALGEGAGELLGGVRAVVGGGAPEGDAADHEGDDRQGGDHDDDGGAAAGGSGGHRAMLPPTLGPCPVCSTPPRPSSTCSWRSTRCPRAAGTPTPAPSGATPAGP